MMNNEFIIANPIYDIAFKRLMDDTENARFFIETLLDQEVGNVEFKPQEYPAPEYIVSRISEMFPHLSGTTKFYRLDFIAAIKTAAGDYQKVLIEVQKGKKSLDIIRFRNYLAEQYKRTDEVDIPPHGRQTVPLHIITVYILGFELQHIPTPAAKIAREYVDLVTKNRIVGKEEFVELLTHDSIILQTTRIHQSHKTDLEALLSLFEQNYFVDANGHFKKYVPPFENEHIFRMAKALSHVAISEEDRLMLETEESVRRIIDGDFNEEMQEVRYKLKMQTEEKELALAREKQALAEKEQALAEKEQLEREQEEQERVIAELLARLNSTK
ncbi:MAG: hypothetical protein LBG58_05925 [Planctomycetaceae bacterium]|jgi:hypothetical protein|nr:hypothetical protein [Planctomycetaceae bacterium]